MPESTAALVVSIVNEIDARLSKIERAQNSGAAWDIQARALTVAVIEHWPTLRAALRALPAAEYERKTTDEERSALESAYGSFAVERTGGSMRVTADAYLRQVFDDLRSCERTLQATAAELAEVKRTQPTDLLLADLDNARRERDALKEALTPSGETKGAYMGEFKFNGPASLDEDGNELHGSVVVPWTTTKEIMAAISKRASRGRAT